MKTTTFVVLLVLFGCAVDSVAAQSVSYPYDGNKEALDLNEKGTAQFKAGHYDQALELFGRAVQLDPDFVVALNNLGATYNALGEHDKAVTVLKPAFTCNLATRNVLRSWSRIRRSKPISRCR